MIQHNPKRTEETRFGRRLLSSKTSCRRSRKSYCIRFDEDGGVRSGEERARLRGFDKKRLVEVAVVIVVYILFLAVGLHAQTAATFDAITVGILGPPNGMQFQSSPVELDAIVRNEKGPLVNAIVIVTVLSLSTGETEMLTGAANEQGIVKVLFPAQSGEYAWYVATKVEGYPTIVSLPRSFSTRLTLIVDCLRPCSSKYPVLLESGYEDLQVIVTDIDGKAVESANVTFYVNSRQVYQTLTNPQGIAKMYWETTPGKYAWFASACKDGEVGVSHLSTFVV